MEYRARSESESLMWALLKALMWVGVAGVVWFSIRPDGWLYAAIDAIGTDWTTAAYHVILGAGALYAGKIWLDQVHPTAVSRFVTFAWALAGAGFILNTLPPL